MKVSRAPFATTAAGEAVEVFTLTNQHGLELRVLSYGGTIVSLSVPGRNGDFADVVLGHDSLEEYVSNTSYFGAIVGRYANRIASARFTLNGKTYRLSANDGPHHLHGGRVGFDRVVWRAESFRTEQATGLELRHTSRDGEEGYPGNLEVQVRYSLTGGNELVIEYHATSDHATPVNLTQHSSFNLSGDTGDILGHQLWVNADRMTPVDEQLIPTGELAAVAGGPFDFRTPTPIGARIESDDPQLRRAGGYDHNFVLNRTGAGLCHAAQLLEPISGRTLDVYTTEPGLQVYSGNFINGRVAGKAGRVYRPRSGVCLETQHFPDSPNQPSFPSTVLRPNEQYRSQTVFAFGVTS
jgi:aldose 1-epimerase